jgi:hypothetical protein
MSYTGLPVILNCPQSMVEGARDSYADLNEALLRGDRGRALTRTIHSWVVRVSCIGLNGVPIIRVAIEA